MKLDNWIIGALLAALVMIIVVLVATAEARAHSAPSGMPYPTDCCDNKGRECSPIPHTAVEITSRGYYVTLQGGQHPNVFEGETAKKLFSYGSRSIRPSTDGLYHACVGKRWNGASGPRDYVPIYCIIIPPQSF